ncbi:tripartite tricarboxylate transporter TctB family protein [Rhodobacter sp. NSM]|uniref:tripartite tricarboxylate transporter TctB family protein n=1 Tax=Rhodobacter sp. NSM TaxID=3457501 RepID=UPI003FD2184E
MDGDYEHHDGTSDASPGGYDNGRRPGEAAFALFLLGGSLFLLWSAYGISGFEALSAPGAVPLAATAVMVVTALIVFIRTFRLPLVAGETIRRDIFPPVAGLLVLLLVSYALLLRPLGFVPTSALFLVASIKLLSRRGWTFTLLVSFGSLLAIWLVFRIVFTVLMPAGIFPEAELIQVLRTLLRGGSS